MNQKEIAKTLSVSIATVSLALRDSPRIKKCYEMKYYYQL